LSLFVPPQFDRQGLDFWIPGQIEPALALICASLPAIWAVLSRFTSRILSGVSSFVSTSRSRSGVSEKGSHITTTSSQNTVVGSRSSEWKKTRSPISTKVRPQRSYYNSDDGASEEALRGDYVQLDEMRNSLTRNAPPSRGMEVMEV
jgi:hypothetical protein